MSMPRSVAASTVLVAALFSALALPGRSDTTGTWAGTIAYINGTHIGVRASAQVKDFLLASDFDNVFSASGQKIKRSDLEVGATVQITYLQSPLFGSTRVTRIDVGLFAPLPLVTGPLPSGAPSPQPT